VSCNIINGTMGADSLEGSNGADSITGDPGGPPFGIDTILGLRGDDSLDGGSGNDDIRPEATTMRTCCWAARDVTSCLVASMPTRWIAARGRISLKAAPATTSTLPTAAMRSSNSRMAASMKSARP
jgi:hypothetical protein